MKKCSIKLKIILIMGVVYAALLTVLLTGVSYAKYMEERTAYANFGAASFNSVILSADNSESEMLNRNVKAFQIFDEALKLQISDYRPGMQYDGSDPTNDTSKKIGFVIANGVNQENASEATVEYQIALRTTGHLPLKYTLRDQTTGKLYPAGTSKTTISPAANIGTVWYEQRFYSEEQEAVFELTGGILDIAKYELIVEWPTDAVSNNARYMKEVELLQLFVTVSSKNKLNEAGTTIEATYGNGMVVLDAAKGNTFIHYVDYRAFEQENANAPYTYTLTVANGVGTEVKQTTERTTYTVEIEVPWTDKTANLFEYGVQRADGAAVNLTTVSNQYRLYDELYNSATYNSAVSVTDPSVADIRKWSQPDSDKRLYKVYTFAGETIGNAARGANQYQLILTETTPNALSGVMVFEHKIKIRIIAQAEGSPLKPTVMAEGGGADG